MSAVLSLPLPLLLLIHLHILEFPLANNPEYDQDLFNPSARGLRDRTKSMEGICYFLVGRIERRDQLKQVLPTYPCLQPSDTVAFRNSLAKYLENLRNQAVRPASGLGENKGKGKGSFREAGWWWKDVVVRKSLLDEAAGERFERILVSLSTQAIMQTLPISVQAALNDTTVRNRPSNYTALVVSCQKACHAWSISASVLVQRQHEIMLLRERLESGKARQSKFNLESASSDRLLALKDTRLQDLSGDGWKGPEGGKALQVLLQVAGLGNISPESEPVANVDGAVTSAHQLFTSMPAIPPPLPIAAAHHSAHLQKLRAPMFRSSGPPSSTAIYENTPQTEDNALKPASTIISLLVDEEAKMQQILRDAQGRVSRVGDELRARLAQLKNADENLTAGPWLSIWGRQGIKTRGVQFEVQPGPELMSSFSLPYPDEDESAVQGRIEHVRDRELTSFPPVPGDPPSPLIDTRSLSPGTEQLPPFPTVQETSHQRQLPTSTPPQSARPRSAHVRKVQGRVSFMSSIGKFRLTEGRRLSVASAMRRPSLFGGEADDDIEDDEQGDIDNIVDSIEAKGEGSTSLQEIFTPKPGTRIVTSGSSTIKRSNSSQRATPRISFAIPDRRSLAPLPEPEWSIDGDDSDDPAEDGHGNSVTLRDILLKAGELSRFELLDDDENGGELEAGSFRWE